MRNFLIRRDIISNHVSQSVMTLTDNQFCRILMDLMRIEGGYSNYTEDSGGETIYGISRRNHPNFSFFSVIDEIKKKPEISSMINQNVSKRKVFLTITGKCDLEFRQHHFDEWLSIMLTYFRFSKLVRFGELIKSLPKMHYDHEFYLAIKSLFFASVNCGNNRIASILNNVDDNDLIALNVRIAKAICDYYRNIIINKPSNKIFANGWKNRIKLSYDNIPLYTKMIDEAF